ncbi:retrovirus-related Pol polyprotein from transposon TNT 1-94 [Trichonephila clavipes]|nr:retrovirus-related Pol polyprotein from transposon TNT 1-94 [Trichonephila clavipes]
MNSVASTLNRVTCMEFNNQISVLTPNNWNTWKHDMQVLLMHYGCWQFIIQTKTEQPDEEATYQEKLNLQLRKDRCYTLIYTNISSDLKNLITETTDGVVAWKILKDHFEPVTRARVIQLLDQFFGTKYQPGKMLESSYLVWKEEDFRVVKIESELILEANRLQLMKQDLEKAENAYLSSFTLKKSKTLPGATAAAHGDPNGKNDYPKKGGKVFNCKTIKNVKQSIKTIGPCYVCNKYGHLKVNCKEKKSLQKSPSTANETFNTEFNINLRFCEAECSLLELDKQLVTSCILFEENSDKGVWVIDTAATSHFCNDKSLFLDLKPITNMKMSLATEDKSCPVEGIGEIYYPVPDLKLTGSNVYYSIEGEATRLKSFNEIERYCKRHNIEYDPSLFNFRKDNTESQGFSDLSEQQALMVEVTIPNCYKQAIGSRDASKWHDAMDREINIMKERKVWDLVDHPDNIKILENRWVYTIKYDENNKIVRYKARLVARGNTQLRGESFDEVFSPVINFTIVRLFFTICVCLWKWTHIQVDITNAYLYANLDTVIYMKQPTGYEIDNNKVCRLRKAIYGLHQSGRQWFLELENKLIKLKFKKLQWVNCVYMFEDNVILLFYVDDIIIFGKEMENVNFVLQLLQKNFDLKIMGKTKKLLGIEFEEIGNSLFIHQRSYIRRLCEIYEKYKYPISSLPISKGQVLSKLDSPKTSEEILTVPYRNLIGSLSFIAIRTRPDIMYAVNVLSQFQANPGIKHWNCLLRLLGYLKYTQEYKLELSKVKSLKLRCYSDSDFATNRDDRVSMGGFITFIDETPISWRTFKQKSVSLSTMEAEYVSLTEAAKEFIWLKNVIDNKSLNLELSENVMFCDNQAAISVSKSPVENYRTKHIDVRYHFLRNLIYDKVFQIKYIGTKNNLADILTKPMMIQDYKPSSRRLSFIRPRFSRPRSPFSPRSDPSPSRSQILLSISCVSFDLLPDASAAVAEWYRHRIVAGFVTSSSPVPLKTRRVGQRCTRNLSRAETSSRWCGVVVRRGEVPAQVSSTSLDHGSKLRGPSPKALVQLNSATFIFTHSLHVDARM